MDRIARADQDQPIFLTPAEVKATAYQSGLLVGVAYSARAYKNAIDFYHEGLRSNPGETYAEWSDRLDRRWRVAARAETALFLAVEAALANKTIQALVSAVEEDLSKP